MASPKPPRGYILQEELVAAAKSPEQFRALRRRLDQRRDTLERLIAEVWDVAAWTEARRVWEDFLPSWQTELKTFDELVSKTQNDAAQQHLRKADRMLCETDKSLSQYLATATPVSLHIAETKLADEVGTRVDASHRHAVAEIESLRDQLRDVTTRLEEMQRKKVLEKSFGEHVATLKSNAVWGGRLWLAAFLGGLLVIPLLVHKYLDKTEWVERLPLAVPLAVFVYFCFHEMKFHRLARIRYENLQGFISGGASEIGEMISGASNPPADATRALNHRLAEILLNIDDLATTTRKSGLPSKELERFVVEVRKMLEAARR